MPFLIPRLKCRFYAQGGGAVKVDASAEIEHSPAPPELQITKRLVISAPLPAEIFNHAEDFLTMPPKTKRAKLLARPP